METIFYSFRDVIEAKNFSASELAKAFNNYYVSPEDFKKFIEKHGDNDKLFIDLLVKLFDDFSCPDLEKKRNLDNLFSDLFSLDKLYDCVNKLISMMVDTSLVRFFKLSARLCSKYRNIEIGGKSIDTKKYFTDLFAMIPKEYMCSKKNELLLLSLSFIIEDINLDNKSVGNYFNQFLGLISIEDLDSEGKYLYDFVASIFDQYFFGDAEELKNDKELNFDSFSFLFISLAIALYEITKRKMTKNKYCQKDKEFIDLVELLRKIYGDKDWIRSLYEIHDGDFLKFISKVLNNFKEAKEPEEKTNEANKIKFKIFLKLLSLGISEAFCNGYRFNVLDLISGHSNKPKSISNICLAYGFSFYVSFVGFVLNGLKSVGIDGEKDDFYLEIVGTPKILVSSYLLNYIDGENANKVLYTIDPQIAFLLGVILAKTWNLNDFIHAKKEYKLEKLFSYNCGFLLAFLMDEAIFGFSNATLEKYISSMRPDSKQKDKIKDMILRISENIIDSKDPDGFLISEPLKGLNFFQSEEKKLDLDKEESCKLAKDKLINFLVETNKECFGDLANKENSTLNKIKDDQKPVPKLLDNINKYKDKCMII